MTVSQYVEIGVTQRTPGDLPARVIEEVVHGNARSGVAREVLGQLGQGTLAASALMLARLMSSPSELAADLTDKTALSLAIEHSLCLTVIDRTPVVKASKAKKNRWQWHVLYSLVGQVPHPRDASRCGVPLFAHESTRRGRMRDPTRAVPNALGNRLWSPTRGNRHS